MPGADSVLRPPARGSRRFLVAVACTGVFLLVYLGAKLLGASGGFLGAGFALPLLAIAPVGWLALLRAPPGQRHLWTIYSAAATCALIGGILWSRAFVAHHVPLVAPGPWDICFFVAYAIAVVGAYAAVRGAISFRHAALDSFVIVAAGFAVGTALVSRGLEGGVEPGSLTTVVRPVLGVVMLTLIASALLEREGVLLSIALVGAGQAFFTIGSFLYSYDAVQGQYTDAPWVYVAWTPGFGLSILAGAVVILGVDRRLQPFPPSSIAGHPRGAKAVLHGSLAALAVSVATAFYGNLTGQPAVLVVGLLATVTIGGAMALRASNSIRELEAAYARLDHGRLAEEQARDELSRANEELARINVELRVVHTAFGDLLELANERTEGGLQREIEDSGDELARLLSPYLRGADD